MVETSAARRRLAVTGASGFVGQALVAAALARGWRVRCLTRGPVSPTWNCETAIVDSIDGRTDWGQSLRGVDAIIHLAGRAHVMGERDGGRLVDFRPLNVDGTRRLAEAAATVGVRRLVFVSSVKVNGEVTSRVPFTAADRPRPEGAYGISKWEAEQALRDVAMDTGLEVVVVRPPLVYGPGARGNFARLVRAVRLGIPLPFGAVENRRSLVGLDNLVDVLLLCAVHGAAAGRVFLVSDGEDLSTPGLIMAVARAMNRRAVLFDVPPGLLLRMARVIGTESQMRRLVASLQVDIGETRCLLGWAPTVPVEEALRRALRGA